MQFFRTPRPILYACLFLALLLFMRSFFAFPSITGRAEFWAESGTNFFCNALKPFSLGVLGALDAGYLALLPRVLSFFTITILGFRDYAPHAQQWAAFLVIALCATSLLKVDWGEQKSSLILKTLLASILLLHWGYGMYVFNNVAYFTVLPVVAFLGFSISDLKRHWKLLCCLMPLLLLNKPYLLAFAPGYCFFALYLLYKREVRASLPFLLAIGLIGIQFAMVFSNRSTFSGGASASLSLEPLFNQIKTAGFFLFYGYEAVFTGFYTKELSYEVRTAITVVLVLAQLVLLTWCFHKKYWRAVWFAVVSITTAFICELMTSVVFFPNISDFTQIPSFLDDSHHFFAFTLLFLAPVGLLTTIISQPKWVLLILVIFAGGSNVFGFWKGTDPIPNLYPLPSNWEQQRALFHEADALIEINPQGWSFRPGTCMIQGS